MTNSGQSDTGPGVEPRLQPAARDGLTAEEQAGWDYMAETHSGRIDGPYSVLAHVPELGGRVAGVETFFRNAPDLPREERELVTIATAREARARFAFAVHEVGARNAGTRPEAIEAVRTQGPIDHLQPREKLLIEITRSLTRTRVLSDDLYNRAVAEFGESLLIKIVALVGHYSTIGLLLNSFQVPPRPTDAPTGF